MIDLSRAREAGYSDEQIIERITQKFPGVTKALQAGYSLDDVVSRINEKTKTQQTVSEQQKQAPQPSTTPPSEQRDTRIEFLRSPRAQEVLRMAKERLPENRGSAVAGSRVREAMGPMSQSGMSPEAIATLQQTEAKDRDAYDFQTTEDTKEVSRLLKTYGDIDDISKATPEEVERVIANIGYGREYTGATVEDAKQIGRGIPMMVQAGHKAKAQEHGESAEHLNTGLKFIEENRDEILDQIRSGKIDKNSDVYKKIRETFNIPHFYDGMTLPTIPDIYTRDMLKDEKSFEENVKLLRGVRDSFTGKKEHSEKTGKNIREWIDGIEWLQEDQYTVRHDLVGKTYQGVAGNMPTFGVMTAASLIPGVREKAVMTALSTGIFASRSGGKTVENLEQHNEMVRSGYKEGEIIEDKDIFDASVIVFASNLALEKVKFAGMDKFIKGGFGKKLKSVGEEFVAEFLQEYPEPLLQAYYENDDKPMEERIDILKDTTKNTIKDALFAGYVSIVSTILTGSAGAGIQKAIQGSKKITDIDLTPHVKDEGKKLKLGEGYETDPVRRAFWDIQLETATEIDPKIKSKIQKQFSRMAEKNPLNEEQQKQYSEVYGAFRSNMEAASKGEYQTENTLLDDETDTGEVDTEQTRTKTVYSDDIESKVVPELGDTVGDIIEGYAGAVRTGNQQHIDNVREVVGEIENQADREYLIRAMNEIDGVTTEEAPSLTQPEGTIPSQDNIVDETPSIQEGAALNEEQIDRVNSIANSFRQSQTTEQINDMSETEASLILQNAKELRFKGRSPIDIAEEAIDRSKYIKKRLEPQKLPEIDIDKNNIEQEYLDEVADKTMWLLKRINKQPEVFQNTDEEQSGNIPDAFSKDELQEVTNTALWVLDKINNDNTSKPIQVDLMNVPDRVVNMVFNDPRTKNLQNLLDHIIGQKTDEVTTQKQNKPGTKNKKTTNNTKEKSERPPLPRLGALNVNPTGTQGQITQQNTPETEVQGQTDTPQLSETEVYQTIHDIENELSRDDVTLFEKWATNKVLTDDGYSPYYTDIEVTGSQLETFEKLHNLKEQKRTFDRGESLKGMPDEIKAKLEAPLQIDETTQKIKRKYADKSENAKKLIEEHVTLIDELLADIEGERREEMRIRMMDDLLGEHGVVRFKDINEAIKKFDEAGVRYVLELADGANLGGLNAVFGDVHAHADAVLKKLWGEMYAQSVIEHGGLIGKSQGDEFKVVWPGYRLEEVQEIRADIERRLREKTKELGVDKAFHPKVRMPTGAGQTYYGLVESIPGMYKEMSVIADKQQFRNKTNENLDNARKSGYNVIYNHTEGKHEYRKNYEETGDKSEATPKRSGPETGQGDRGRTGTTQTSQRENDSGRKAQSRLLKQEVTPQSPPTETKQADVPRVQTVTEPSSKKATPAPTEKKQPAKKGTISEQTGIPDAILDGHRNQGRSIAKRIEDVKFDDIVAEDGNALLKFSDRDGNIVTVPLDSKTKDVGDRFSEIRKEKKRELREKQSKSRNVRGESDFKKKITDSVNEILDSGKTGNQSIVYDEKKHSHENIDNGGFVRILRDKDGKLTFDDDGSVRAVFSTTRNGKPTEYLQKNMTLNLNKEGELVISIKPPYRASNGKTIVPADWVREGLAGKKGKAISLDDTKQNRSKTNVDEDASVVDQMSEDTDVDADTVGEFYEETTSDEKIEFYRDNREAIEKLRNEGRITEEKYQESIEALERYATEVGLEFKDDGVVVHRMRSLTNKQSSDISKILPPGEWKDVEVRKADENRGRLIAAMIQDNIQFETVKPGQMKGDVVLFESKLQFSDRVTKGTFTMPVDATVSQVKLALHNHRRGFQKARTESMYSEIGKLLPNSKNLPTVVFGTEVKFTNGKNAVRLNKDDYGAVVYDKNGDVTILINPDISFEQIFPTLVHELIGHTGADVVFKNADPALYKHARDLFVKEYNSDSKMIKDLRKRGYKEGELFNEWVAYNVERAAVEYFDDSGKFIQEKYDADTSVVRKVYDFIREMVGKLYNKWMNKPPTQKEIDTLSKALIQEMRNITEIRVEKAGTHKNKAPVSETKSDTPKKKRKTYTAKQRVEAFTLDLAKLKTSLAELGTEKIIGKKHKIRFINFGLKHFFGEGADSYRTQFENEIEQMKEVGDKHYTKALELALEYQSYKQVKEAVGKANRFFNKHKDKVGIVQETKVFEHTLKDSQGNVITVTDRKEKPTGRWIESPKGIKVSRDLFDQFMSLNKLSVMFEDFNTLKRLADRGGKVLKPFKRGTIEPTTPSPKYQRLLDSKDIIVKKIDGVDYYVLQDQGNDKIRALKERLVGYDVFDETIREFNPDNIEEKLRQLNDAIMSQVISKEGLKADSQNRTTKVLVQKLAEQLESQHKDKSPGYRDWKIYQTLDRNHITKLGNIFDMNINTNLSYKAQAMDGYKEGGWFTEVFELMPLEARNRINRTLDVMGETLRSNLRDIGKQKLQKSSDYLVVGMYDKLKNNVLSGPEGKTYEFENGTLNNVTDAVLVSIYKTLKSNGGYRHLTSKNGGLRLQDARHNKSTKVLVLTDRDVVKIADIVNNDKTMKQMDRAFTEYFKKTRELVNEITKEYLGEELLNEGDTFFPFRVSDESFDVKVKDIKTVSGATGILREAIIPKKLSARVKADNPLIITDPFSVVAGHAGMIRKFLDNIMVDRVLDTVINDSALEKKFIDKGMDHIRRDFSKRINDHAGKGVYIEQGEKVGRYFTGLYMGSKMGYNPGPALNNSISALLFLNEVSLNPVDAVKFFGSLNLKTKRELTKEMMEVSDEARMRFNDTGYEATMLGNQENVSASQLALDRKKGLDRFLSSRGAMDMSMGVDKHITHTFGWWALKRETENKLEKARKNEERLKQGGLSEAKRKVLENEISDIKKAFRVDDLSEFKIGNDKYKDYMNRRFTVLVTRTQNTFDTRTASPLQRWYGIKAITMFMSQPLKTGMIVRKQLALAYNAKNPVEASGHVFKAAFTIFGQAAILQTFRSMISVITGRLEPEEAFEFKRWLKGIGESSLAVTLGVQGIVISLLFKDRGHDEVWGGALGSLFKNAWKTGEYVSKKMIREIKRGNFDRLGENLTDVEDLYKGFFSEGLGQDVTWVLGGESIYGMLNSAVEAVTGESIKDLVESATDDIYD